MFAEFVVRIMIVGSMNFLKVFAVIYEFTIGIYFSCMIQTMVEDRFAQVTAKGSIDLNFEMFIPQFAEKILYNFFCIRFIGGIPACIKA